MGRRPALEICGSPDRPTMSGATSPAFVRRRYSGPVAVDDRPADGVLSVAGGQEQGPTVRGGAPASVSSEERPGRPSAYASLSLGSATGRPSMASLCHPLALVSRPARKRPSACWSAGRPSTLPAPRWTRVGFGCAWRRSSYAPTTGIGFRSSPHPRAMTLAPHSSTQESRRHRCDSSPMAARARERGAWRDCSAPALSATPDCAVCRAWWEGCSAPWRLKGSMVIRRLSTCSRLRASATTHPASNSQLPRPRRGPFSQRCRSTLSCPDFGRDGSA